MEAQRRQILAAVADGQLTPEEGAARLDDLERGAQAAPQASIRALKVVCSVGTAEIAGDSGVREAVAEGPHAVRREGDTLVIESHPDDSADWPYFRFSQARGERVRELWRHRPHSLRIRMNPDLPLEIRCLAGRLLVQRVNAPVRAEVSAGSVEIERFASPLDIAVLAGRVRASGVLNQGSSRIRCETGKVQLHLERGSSVRVRTSAVLGKVILPGRGTPGSGWSVRGASQEMTVGTGAGSLEVEASMGKIEITADE